MMKLSISCAALLLVLLSACTAPEQPTAATAHDDAMLRFVPIDDGAVEVHWPGSATDGAIVTWENGRGERIGEMEAIGNPAVIPALDPAESYLVVVRPRPSGGLAQFIRGMLTRGEPVDPVGGLEAVSMSKTSVKLSWTRSPLAGATYLVGWRKSGGADSGSMTSTATSAVVTNLEPGIYTFSVRATMGNRMSPPTSIQWAAATRYTMDASNPGLTLRMHEVESEYGPALILDPSKGGPRNVGVRTGDPLSSVALAIYTDQAFSEHFDIGPGYALVGFRNADKFDSSTYISRNAFRASSLDDFILTDPLDTYISFEASSAGNLSAFRLPISEPDGKGIGFVVRHGTPGNYHYARVFVRNIAGKLLQGLPPNRYVEVEISYQEAPNVPYAKRVAATPAIPATRRR